FGERVTSPELAIEKEYRVRLDRPLAPAHRAALARAMELPDGTLLLPACVGPDPDAPDDPRALTLTIVEGKNRQIRPACKNVGYDVERLHRVRIGAVRLGDLAPGQSRDLTPAEVASYE